MSRRSPERPVGVAGHRERGDAAGAGALGGAREHGVDVGVGRVGDPGLLAVQPPAVAVGGRAAATVRAASEPASGSESANAGDGVAGHDTGDPALTGDVGPGLEDRVAAQPLEGERGLGLGGDGGQRLAQQAQLHGGRVAGRLVGGAAEEAAQQPVLAQRFDQRAG